MSRGADDDDPLRPPPSVVTVVHCWSSPRSRSTALLYSFEARRRGGGGGGGGSSSSSSATVAIDEPLYRRWLVEKGDAVERPYARELIDGVPPEGREGDADEVRRWARERSTVAERIADAVSELSRGGGGDDGDGGGGGNDEGGGRRGRGGVIFCKHMAKHAFLWDFHSERETSFGGAAVPSPGVSVRHVHVLLVRDPVAVLSSWEASGGVHGNNPTPDEVGMVPLLGIHSTLASRPGSSSSSGSGGSTPPPPAIVLDSDALASDPEGTLRALCEDLDIEYTDKMLTWESGPHDCDGPWADWWYANVHKSTGWFGHGGSETDPTGGGGGGGNDEGKGEEGGAGSYPQTYVPPRERKFRTLNPSLVDTLRASMPAYQYLRSLTRQHRERGTLTPAEMYEDPRNENLLVWVGAPGRGMVVPRDMAAISPWDSSVQGGDAAWEGLRVYRGKILSLEKHLRRLFKSAKALGFENVHTKEQVVEAIFRTLAANGMRDGAHMRLTLTRGEKCTSSMNPKFNVYGTTLIILPEWKPTEGATTYDNTKGISLITASTRRNPPSTVDSKIHHNNMINNILPKIQANLAGAADAIMLDLEGYVSETNATNLFMVDDGVLLTPHADHCLPGITRETVLLLAEELGVPSEVRRVSLAEFHAADEVFTTGTMGELTPVTAIDGRTIGNGSRGPVTERLQGAYRTLPDRPGWATEIPPFY